MSVCVRGYVVVWCALGVWVSNFLCGAWVGWLGRRPPGHRQPNITRRTLPILKTKPIASPPPKNCACGPVSRKIPGKLTGWSGAPSLRARKRDGLREHPDCQTPPPESRAHTSRKFFRGFPGKANCILKTGARFLEDSRKAHRLVGCPFDARPEA